ncbi:MAG: divergent PAP2 family protein [Candidatus Saganbacteria bacterium]|nr:divergent PAP2 family protein [Candidatus Saganbacteria bacterium]
MFDFLVGIIESLLSNYPLIVAGTACLAAQIIKIFYYWIRDKKFELKHLFEAGGMPSAHSASVTALFITIGIIEGFFSPYFAIAFTFAVIVMYDATGVRRAAGMQALILNRIMEDIYSAGKENPEKLKELIGHTPFEVLMGILVGIVTTLVFFCCIL